MTSARTECVQDDPTRNFSAAGGIAKIPVSSFESFHRELKLPTYIVSTARVSHISDTSFDYLGRILLGFVKLN